MRRSFMGFPVTRRLMDAGPKVSQFTRCHGSTEVSALWRWMTGRHTGSLQTREVRGHSYMDAVTTATLAAKRTSELETFIQPQKLCEALFIMDGWTLLDLF
ncbi:hypothetical protein QQF64_012699 [Cirrhinus molitorella]|uniref:Uncharacterized protein n=1 Tax=Cirrhinus molitorella TaxID=172907 RepID=A0ABR3LZE8_9TELE